MLAREIFLIGPESTVRSRLVRRLKVPAAALGGAVAGYAAGWIGTILVAVVVVYTFNTGDPQASWGAAWLGQLAVIVAPLVGIAGAVIGAILACVVARRPPHDSTTLGGPAGPDLAEHYRTRAPDLGDR